MNISQVGIDLIKSFEGCRLYAYKPVPWEQYWTIGWGHYGSDVYEGMTLTQKQADDLFISDIQRYINAVRNAPLGFKPNQNQFDALCSFCYNLGTGIMEDFRGMSSAEVSREIPLYNKAGGQVLEGLVRRRKAEKELFDKGTLNPPTNTSREIVTNEKVEFGTFYPNDLIYFRNKPLIDNSNPIIGSYAPPESVNYDYVVFTNKYIYISWISESTKIRRYMPIREVINGRPQEMWGRIE